MTRTDYPDGSFEEWSYNQFGQTLTNRWRNGGVEVFTYYGTNEAGGLLGDLKSRTDPMGATQTYTWDSSGLLTSLADARSNIAHFVFDWRGNLLAQTNADGTALSYQYDVFGNRTNIVNELGHATTSTYDGYNRVKTVTDPLGRVTEHEYGRIPGCGCGVSVSTLARVTAPDGKMIEYAYDHSDKRTNETIAAGTAEAATTSWTYDSVGRKATQTDANGNLHTWNYDALDRVAAEINAAGDVTTYAYDAEGNLTNRVDGAGIETTWEYDAMDRIVAMGSGALRYEYEYDLGGRRTAMHTRINGNTTETTTYTYDLNNRLLTKTDPTGYALDYGYDAVGNRTNLLVTGASPASSGMVQVSYQYDPRNRLMTLTGNGRTTAFQYDALGRRTNAVWPNGTTAAYAYDEANQLLSLIHASAATTIASFVYAYDLGGNRTNMITLEGTNSYGYDNRDWLTSAIYPDGSSQEFRYDPVGNRTNLLEIHGTSSVLTAYSYGSANRLLSSASAVEVNEYAYDGAGRLTNHVVNGQPRRFAYNYRGQMTVLHDKDERIFTYDFDGDGNRISQSLNDCLETRFVYDGPDVILDLSAGGGSADGGNGSNELVHAYVNGLGIDQPIERIGFIAGQPRQRHVYHADALGSIVAMTDDAGTTVKTYTYEAFGSIRAEMQALHVNRYTFTAREAIGDSRDLMYYRYRVMSSRTGRFTSFDPLRFVDGANKYLYVVNGPLMMNDPMGLLADTGGHAVDLSPAICAGIGAARFLQMKYEDKRHGEKAGRDKWYHCVTSCQITKVCGAEFAESLGNAKERGKNPNDPDTASDQKANADGRDCGKCSKQSCVKCCEEKGYAK
ncbi:MAG: hypothetical protein M5U15_14285 [Kiritimatiellae bacterium]|nr:hypothetical protein [Kiritimatiellia bacterium]